MLKSLIRTALVLCSFAPAVLRGQAPAGAPPELLKAMDAWTAAIDQADVAAWERLTTRRWTAVNASGKLVTRDERIAELKEMKPAAAPSACASDRVTVFAGGNAATRRCLTGGNWRLEVWTKSGENWEVVAVQITPAAK
jgi:hypothetical protein